MRKFKYVKSIMLYGYTITHKTLWGPRDNPIYRRIYLQCLGKVGEINVMGVIQWDRKWLMEAATWTRKMK